MSSQKSRSTQDGAPSLELQVEFGVGLKALPSVSSDEALPLPVRRSHAYIISKLLASTGSVLHLHPLSSQERLFHVHEAGSKAKECPFLAAKYLLQSSRAELGVLAREDRTPSKSV